MPTINAANQLPMAILGREVGIPAPIGSPPEGHLTSRELFMHVLALTWGDRADYNKHVEDTKQAKAARKIEIDNQWEDASDKIREAIGAGELDPVLVNGTARVRHHWQRVSTLDGPYT